ncbi:MAG: hypothetical protein ACI9W4_001018 [Rhodothermales bacterium]|jgi:hypothetical protein
MNRINAYLLGIALLCGATLPASAQSHTIRIEGGLVYVDGTLQKSDSLPSALDLEGLTASLSFSGPTHFRLGKQAFFIEHGRLVEAEPSDDDFVVFDGRQGQQAFAYTDGQGNTFDLLGTRVGRGKDIPVRIYYDALDGQLREMDQLHTEFDRTRSVKLADRMREESGQAAEMVRAFPRIELQTYLEDLQDRNAGLYDGILREHLMEMETRRLASQILATADDSRREELRAHLSERLEEIFELKQENRRAEIEQLDGRLRELRSLLDIRQIRKGKLIGRRIQDLLDAAR